MTDRKTGSTPVNKRVRVFGESGGFYYTNVVGENTYGYMWKDNLTIREWYRLSELENHTIDSTFPAGRATQGFAIDDQYCYSFEIPLPVYDNNGHLEMPGKDEDGLHHKLYRTNHSNGQRVEMTPLYPQSALNALYHANDACIVEFNGVSYIFVMAYSDVEDENYIVKLGFNNTTNKYWEVARYPTNNFKFAGITLLSGGGLSPAVFLLKHGPDYYKATIAANKESGTNVWGVLPSTDFSTVQFDVNNEVPQGIHYEQSNGKLYAAFHIVTKVNENTKRVYQNHIHEYNNVICATGTLPIANVDEIMFIPAEYAEVEGIGFLPGNGHDYLLFLTFEGSSRNAGVYRANNIIR